MKIPKEIRESEYLQTRLPKIDIEEILDVHKKLSRMTTKKFWELLYSRTNIRKKTISKSPDKINGVKFYNKDRIAEYRPTDYPDHPDEQSDIADESPTPDWRSTPASIPKSSDMNWECEHCGFMFIASWSPLDTQAYGFPNPMCPHCDRWEVRFIK